MASLKKNAFGARFHRLRRDLKNSSDALAGAALTALPDFTIEAHVACGALTPVLTDYPPPDAGLYVVRPTGDLPPRKVRVPIDIVLEHFGAGQSRAAT